MTDRPLHFTMRELQRLAFAPRFWAAIAGASLLLGLVGPFGTYEGLRLPARLAYWAATAVATYFTGVAVVFLQVHLFSPGRMPGFSLFALFGAIAGIPVAAVVWLINTAVFESSGRAIPFPAARLLRRHRRRGYGAGGPVHRAVREGDAGGGFVLSPQAPAHSRPVASADSR